VTCLHKYWVSLGMVLAIILILTAGLVNAKNTVEIKDMLGRTVMVPVKVKKVVGIEAGALSLLVYLDAAPLVAGVEDTEQKELTKPYLIFLSRRGKRKYQPVLNRPR
jgi:ABC-type Fe3+-hydroxamate transport system substrate-binding protein